MKIRLPAQTVKIDAAAWSSEYGVPIEKVRADVKSYFSNLAQEIIDSHPVISPKENDK